MRYLGVRAMEVNVIIEKKDVEVSDESAVINVLNILKEHGNTFKVMMPENVNTLNDAKYIAFECITGFPYVKEFYDIFEIKLDSIKHKNEEFIYCLTIAELKDFEESAVRSFIEEKDSVQVESVATEEPKEAV